MPSTDDAIRAAKPREMNCKLSDEKRLFFLNNLKDTTGWNPEFRVAGKEMKLSLEFFDVACAGNRAPQISIASVARIQGKGGEARLMQVAGALLHQWIIKANH